MEVLIGRLGGVVVEWYYKCLPVLGFLCFDFSVYVVI